MNEVAEAEGPDADGPSGDCDLDTLSQEDDREPAGYQTPPEIVAEIESWRSLGRDDRITALRKQVTGRIDASPEALVFLCCEAHGSDDRATLNLAFEALSRRATPLLWAQALGKTPAERQEQVQTVLEHTFVAIQKGKAAFAQSHFAAFAKRRAVSIFRSERSRFEAVNRRIVPLDDADPLDTVPTRHADAERKALLAISLDKLSEKSRAVFIQTHVFQMPQEEIAAHHDCSTRWVRSLLRDAEALIGFAGDDDDR